MLENFDQEFFEFLFVEEAT